MTDCNKVNNTTIKVLVLLCFFSHWNMIHSKITCTNCTYPVQHQYFSHSYRNTSMYLTWLQATVNDRFQIFLLPIKSTHLPSGRDHYSTGWPTGQQVVTKWTSGSDWTSILARQGSIVSLSRVDACRKQVVCAIQSTEGQTEGGRPLYNIELHCEGEAVGGGIGLVAMTPSITPLHSKCVVWVTDEQVTHNTWSLRSFEQEWSFLSIWTMIMVMMRPLIQIGRCWSIVIYVKSYLACTLYLITD